MLLEEMCARLKDESITEEQLWAVTPIYCLLDFDKDDFCKLIQAIGIEKWLQKAERWKRLDRAEIVFTARERYIKSMRRLEEIANEKIQLEEYVKNWEEGQVIY